MKKIIPLTIASLVFLTSCGVQENITSHPKHYQTTKSYSGTLETSSSYIGYIASDQSATLSSKIPGKILTLTKNIGDSVIAGEVIGTLETKESQTGYSSAGNIISELQSLKNSTQKSYDSQIDALKEKLNQQNISQEMSNITYQGSAQAIEDIKNIESTQLQSIDAQLDAVSAKIQELQTQLTNTNTQLEKQNLDLYSNSTHTLTQANIFLTNTQDFLDNLLGVSQQNKHKNDDFELYLGAKVSGSLNQTQNTLTSIINTIPSLESLPLNSHDDILHALERYHIFFTTDIRTVLQDTYTLLENSIDNVDFPLEQIQSLKSQVTGLQSQAESLILSVSGNQMSGLKGNIDTIKNFDIQKQSTLDALEASLVSAQKESDALRSQKENIISQIQAELTNITTQTQLSESQTEITKSQYQELQLQIQSLQAQSQAALAEIDTQIAQIKASQNDASVMIENGKIISQISGIITQKFANIGETIAPGIPIYHISNTNTLKVEVLVGDEIQFLHIGDTLQVDTGGVDIIHAQITAISPQKDAITKKTLIELTLPPSSLVLGSYVNVTISNNNSDALGVIIPKNAILNRYGTPGVLTIQDGVAHFQHITILTSTDTHLLVDGLQDDVEVITEGKEHIYDGDILSSL